MFDDNQLIAEGEELLTKIEKSLRDLKTEYSKTLADFESLKNGNAEVFNEVEGDYLNLLSRIQKSIRTTSELWDKTISKIEKMRDRKRLRDESFLTGILWSLDQAAVPTDKKAEIVDLAKRLIALPKVD